MRTTIVLALALLASCGTATMESTSTDDGSHGTLNGSGLSVVEEGSPPVVDAGVPRNCSPGELKPCTTSCGSTGTRACIGEGDWSPACTPPMESCDNGVDDDCDGQVDDADDTCWSCTPGQSRSCTTACGSSGRQSCAGNGQWPAQCQPPVEVCDNGVDDDCDGLVDAAQTSCWSCTPGQSRNCATTCGSTGRQSCTGNGQWPTQCQPPVEICNNGVDDDCDGKVDAAQFSCWSCTPGQTRSCTTPCGSNGTQGCETNGQWRTTCQPPSEICNNGVDDDCDGKVDAAQPVCWTCTPGQTRSCTTTCNSTGVQSCLGNGQWPATCQPPGEVCNDGIDNDCDGHIDAQDFDCPGPHHSCETTEGNGCNGDWGYGDHCAAADNTGGCSASRFWAWCNRRNTAYPGIWDGWVHDWVSSRCDGTTTLNGNTFSCLSSTNDTYQCSTPLVLVFDAAPVQYRFGGSFAFTPGERVGSDWPTAATPWLVRDLNGNGQIDDGSELFGSGTRLPDGSFAHDGFEALAALDLNRDGVLDAKDAAFSSLQLWSDANGDRRVQAGELVGLRKRGVTSFQLNFRVEPRCDDRGNCERERAGFTWSDASGAVHTGALVDVWLATTRSADRFARAPTTDKRPLPHTELTCLEPGPNTSQ